MFAVRCLMVFAFALFPVLFPLPCTSALCPLPSALTAPSINDLLNQYSAGEFDASVYEARKAYPLPALYKALRAAGGAPNWVNGDSRRRLIAATFVLDVLDAAAVARAGNWNIGQPPQILLEYACGLLREQDTPLAAEKQWHLAAIALIEGSGVGAALERHLGHAEQRFSGEPRFVLASAVAAELKTWPDRRGAESFEGDRDDAVDRRKKYERASKLPAVSAEAHLRWGMDELRQGRAPAALVHFDEARKSRQATSGSAAPDPYVRYLVELFRGRAFDQRGDFAGAVASYRAALAITPRAQSAAIGLAAALVRSDQRDEAAKVTNEMLGSAPSHADPWLFYGKADARFWPAWIKALRAEVIK